MNDRLSAVPFPLRATPPAGQQYELTLGAMGGLVVESVSPYYLKLALAKRLYVAGTGAGTAIAPVATMPTTTAQWTLYNGNNSRYLIPLKVACYSSSGTLGLGMSLLVAMSTAAQAAAVTKYTNSTISGITPGSLAVPGGIFGQNVTLAGAPSWFPIATRDQVSAVSVGSGLNADLDGLVVIPPTYAFGINVLAPVGTTALFGVSVLWAEVDVAIE